jgi:alcohol dehydrogenase class IV
VIGLGGGSSLDVAKLVALLARGDESLSEVYGVGLAKGPRLPLLLAPTTAGTGSEVTPISIVTTGAHEKKGVVSPVLIPDIALLDPELTLGLPPQVTATTGMDALSHCLEAYCAPGFHPMADGIAAEGMKLIRHWLPRAFEDGSDVEARGHMLVAASMGATAFQKGLGGMHALSHPIGALKGTHHGLTNAVLMPYVLAFNRPAVEDRLARLACYLGLEDASFDGFIAWVIDLRQRLAIPHGLAGIGVEEADLERIAAMAEADPSAAGNPLPFDCAGARTVLEAAMAGRMTV